jgi:hypothetical protein
VYFVQFVIHVYVTKKVVRCLCAFVHPSANLTPNLTLHHSFSKMDVNMG